MSIKCAEFIGDPTSGEVIIGGKKPYFYSYDTITGRTQKIPGLIPSYLLLNLSFNYFYLRNLKKSA